MQFSQRSTHIFFPVALALSLSVIYLQTMAPGLSWANSGADGGDLITAATVRGVAHPSGYPLYMLLAQIFQHLPLNTLAYRTNLMSAVFAVLTSLLIYKVVVAQFSAVDDKVIQSLAGLGAGFSFGLSPLLWSQAVITEVYTLHAFWIMLIVGLVVHNRDSLKIPMIWHERLLGLVYGLAACNHLTVLLFIPGAIIVSSCFSKTGSARDGNKKRGMGGFQIQWKSIARQLVWFLVGLSVYLILPVRAYRHPVINWGNPVSVQGFWWLVSARLYRSYYFTGILSPELSGISHWANLLIQQFGGIGLIIGVFGLVIYFKRSRLFFVTIWNFVVFSVFVLLDQAPDANVLFLPACISFSIWIGICLGSMMKRFSNFSWVWSGLFMAIWITIFIFGVVENWRLVDASKDLRAEEFGNQVIADLPGGAIVFVDGDQAVFAAWYFHYALEKRPDLVILAEDLLSFDWYLESMRLRYPEITLPEPYPWPVAVSETNSERPVCYLRYEYELNLICDYHHHR
ncbi:MAG: DUF2723 domain-containing protein [Anaerolineales bacterium]|nr:DUF2723 domain-containing protein [Anaerolineales bacterium]